MTELLSCKRAIPFLPSLPEQAELLPLQPDWAIQLLPSSGLLPTPGAQHLISRQVGPFGSQPSSQVLQVTIGCTQDSISFHLLLALTKSSNPSQKGKAFKKKTPKQYKTPPQTKNQTHKTPNQNCSQETTNGKKKRKGCKGLHLKRFTPQNVYTSKGLRKLKNWSVEDWRETASKASLRAPTTPWRCPERQWPPQGCSAQGLKMTWCG